MLACCHGEHDKRALKPFFSSNLSDPSFFFLYQAWRDVCGDVGESLWRYWGIVEGLVVKLFHQNQHPYKMKSIQMLYIFKVTGCSLLPFVYWIYILPHTSLEAKRMNPKKMQPWTCIFKGFWLSASHFNSTSDCIYCQSRWKWVNL